MIKYQTEEFSKIENWQKQEIQPNDIVKVDYIDKDKTYSITLKRLQIVYL